MRLCRVGWAGAEEKGPRLAADLIIKSNLYRNQTRKLLDSLERRVEPNDVGPEIFAVGAHVLVRAARLELVVPSVTVVVLNESDAIHIRHEVVDRWPGRRRIVGWGRNQTVIAECVRAEALADARDRDTRLCTTGIATA